MLANVAFKSSLVGTTVVECCSPIICMTLAIHHPHSSLSPTAGVLDATQSATMSASEEISALIAGIPSDSQVLETFKGLLENTHDVSLARYSVFKKQLIQEFGAAAFEQDKALVSRTLQNIVERAEFLARSLVEDTSSPPATEDTATPAITTTTTTTPLVNNGLYTWGRFLDSTEDENKYIHPTLCDRWAHSSTTIVQVACSWQISSALYLTDIGDVYRCDAMEEDPGSEYLMLDRPTTGTGSPNHPQLIRTFTHHRALHKRVVIAIATGSHHSVALSNDGHVFTWGSGSKGALGHGDISDQGTPREIAALGEHHVVAIAAGGQHTLFVCDTVSTGSFFKHAEMKRKVYGCGDNRQCQLGSKSKKIHLIPRPLDALPKDFVPVSVHCGWDFSGVVGFVKLKSGGSSESGESGGSGSGSTTENKIDSRPSSDVAPPIMNVLMWGRNDQGQCGIGKAQQKVSTPEYLKQPWSKICSVNDLSCGQGHALCVANGEVYVWGNGENGQLGTHQVLALEPEAIEGVHFRDKRGNDTHVIRVCAGPFHSVAVTTGGRVFTWGMNSLGALGLGHTNNRGTPTQVTFAGAMGTDTIPGEDGSSTATENRTSTRESSGESKSAGSGSKSAGSGGGSTTNGESSTTSGGSSTSSDGTGSTTSAIKMQRRRSVSFCDRLPGNVRVWTSFHATVVLCRGKGSPTQSNRVHGSSPSNNTASSMQSHRPDPNHNGSNHSDSSNVHLRVLSGDSDASGSSGSNTTSGGSDRIRKRRDVQTKWLENVVPQWHRVYKETWVRKMICEGIPADIRMYVWPLCIGNGIKATPEMFTITIERALQLQSLSKAAATKQREQEEKERLHQDALSSPSSPTTTTPTTTTSDSSYASSTFTTASPNKAKDSLAVIDADLNRTFPQMKLFGDGGHWGDDLRCVLEAFACHRPDLGYVQGMSYIAAMLLLHIPDRYMVFQCLTNLLVKGHLFQFYRLGGHENHAKYCTLFQQVIDRQLPHVAQHLVALDVTPMLYFYPWIQTIFLKYLPASTSSRIWDQFLAGGEINGTAFLYKTAVAVLLLLAPEIVHAPMEIVMNVLQRRPASLHVWERTVYDETKLFSAIEKISLSNATLLSIQRANGDVFEYHPRYVANVVR